MVPTSGLEPASPRSERSVLPITPRGSIISFAEIASLSYEEFSQKSLAEHQATHRLGMGKCRRLVRFAACQGPFYTFHGLP